MWRKNYSYLNDADFIKNIDTQHLQKQYVKITLLDWNENPIQEIQGLASGGSISVNGDSAVRRTCSLTMVVKGEEFAITSAKNLISIGRKAYIEIGVSNNTDKFKKEYPIVWFPQGMFVFTQCSLSTSNSGTTLSAQLKDKMCLLNGECGGTFTQQVQLNYYPDVDTNGTLIKKYPTISQILKEAVNHWGGEQLGNILISDIDEQIKAQSRWIGNVPVYYSNTAAGPYLTTDYSTRIPEGKTLITCVDYEEIKSIARDDSCVYLDQSTGNIYNANLERIFEVYNYGDFIGFIYTDFIYTQDLIVNPGDNICTGILDKIKSYLGNNYEYFYDVYGNFRFQEIKNYLNTTQATVDVANMKNQDYVIDITKGKSVYDFSDSKLITSFSNNPQYNRIKNDFVVWGSKKGTSGITTLVRYHLAIDVKPEVGHFYELYFCPDPYDGNYEKPKIPIRYDSLADIEANPGEPDFLYKDVSTGFVYKWNSITHAYEKVDNLEPIWFKTTDWRTALYLKDVQADPLGEAVSAYYGELDAEWPYIYNFKANQETNGIDPDTGETIATYYTGEYYDYVIQNPWELNYWLDFIDSNAAIGEISIPNIGRRSFSEKKDDYNSVFERPIPDLIIINTEDPDAAAAERRHCQDIDQPYVQVDPALYSFITMGMNNNSCFERIKAALYDYTSYNSSISIGILPIYHLEPNTRITINSKENDMFGDYLIKSFSIPLTINGTMNISATQCNSKL